MKGLELARKYYETHGKAAIEKEFPLFADKIAVGLVGEGSECFGFDDELSTDHDFEPSFCLWLDDETYTQIGFNLERLYRSLPEEFLGFKRQRISPVGGNRHGVMKIGDFYGRFLGFSTAPESLEHWLALPSYALAEAVNGEVFCDNLGEFSAIRNELLKGYPEDVLLKKLSARLVMMAQTGLYNYNRLIKRGENGAAQLSLFKFVEHTISAVYLLNNKYEPFYKWAYRGMRDLEILGDLEPSLVALTELGNSEIEAKAKSDSIEEICNTVVKELKRQGKTDYSGLDLERHAMSVANKISDPKLRNLHIMDGI